VKWAFRTGWSNILSRKGIERDHALRIMSFGFAFGLLSGRIAATWILHRFTAANVVCAGSVLMALSTLWVLLSGSNSTLVASAVFCAGFAMGPVFPTNLGMVGDLFPRATGTAMGLVITSGWLGLAVSSRLIGAVCRCGRIAAGASALPVSDLVGVHDCDQPDDSQKCSQGEPASIMQIL